MNRIFKIVICLILTIGSLPILGRGMIKTHRPSNLTDAVVKKYVKQIAKLATKKPDSTLQYIADLEKLIKRADYYISNEDKSSLYLSKGAAQYKIGHYNRALKFLNTSAELIHKDSVSGTQYFYLGLSNKLIGNYSQATDNFIKSIKKFEEKNKTYPIINVYINLGNVCRQIKNHKQALNYYTKALEMAQSSGNEKLNRLIYNNMGNVFLDLHDYETALFQFKASYLDSKKTNNRKGQVLTLINIADAKEKLGQQSEALEHLTLALRLSDTIGVADLKGKVFYELGQFFVEVKNQRQAEFYLDKAFTIADTLHHYPDLQRIYKSYKDLYTNIGRHKKALEYYQLYEAVKDSVTSRENSLKVTQLYSEFNFEKKEQELELLEQEKELQDQKNKVQFAELEAQRVKGERDSIFIYLLIGIGILLLVLAAALGLISSLKHKKNGELEEINQQLADSEYEIKVQNETLAGVNNDLEIINREILNKNIEVEAQKEELQAQRDLLNLTNEQLKDRNKDVTDSIHYAQKIQQAMLNSSFQIDESGMEHFTFYKPRDIVSGDFYWSHQVEDELIVAIGDCTGHGVPGAFMSCLGISLLNEIVFGREIIEPHTILEELRNSVIQLIATDRNTDLQIGDGMDIAIVVINKTTKNMKFSGAMNSVKIISDGELIELKGDKSPIGQHIIQNHTFTMQEHQLKVDDHIYMTTDGYKDQFGGPKGKKMGKRRVNEQLVRISELSVPVQYTEIISIYKNWRNFEEQVDDVCLFGMKIS